MTPDIEANVIPADLETLWTTYSRQIYGYIYKAVRDHDVTDDLVSAVYLRATVAYANGHAYDTHESGWIWTIARNVIKDHWRVMRRVKLIDFDSLAEQSATDAQPDEQAEHQMLLARVRAAVAQLPELQAMVTTWRMCGYDYDEIAEGLGKSYGALKAIQVRAYVTLRERLEAA
jgi:RNA polymerase sigma factor (sigma-70 family)